jgi:hypothetical protein
MTFKEALHYLLIKRNCVKENLHGKKVMEVLHTVGHNYKMSITIFKTRKSIMKNRLSGLSICSFLKKMK